MLTSNTKTITYNEEFIKIAWLLKVFLQDLGNAKLFKSILKSTNWQKISLDFCPKHYLLTPNVKKICQIFTKLCQIMSSFCHRIAALRNLYQLKLISKSHCAKKRSSKKQRPPAKNKGLCTEIKKK